MLLLRREVWLCMLSGLVLAGCGRPKAEFTLNLVQTRVTEKGLGELSAAQQQNVADILGALFGDPDNPVVPTLPGVDTTKTLDEQKLYLAAGPVGSDERGLVRGLYRLHCVHCHGVTGDGAGPTAAFLNPYPRDYRRGTFKFKSTPGAQSPPTHDDLKRILVDGIPGTAMPSFKVLDDGEIDALVHYVKYLSVRGQFEKKLINLAADEPDEGELFLDQSQQNSEVFRGRITQIQEELGALIQTWQDAKPREVPAAPEHWESTESVLRGRELFYTTLTNCSKCHGDSALGDGQTTDWDEWTKDWTVALNIDPKKDHAEIAEFLRRGALPPRNARPRNLRLGAYRGGRRPIDLYWRIKNGIAGMPMPEASTQLSGDDIWHLVAYVRSLPYESMSQPVHPTEYQRDLP